MNLDDRQLAHLTAAIAAPDLDGTPYILLGEIGRGGMGVVYRAFDPRLGREVALKVVETGEADEARVAASLEHPGIVPVYDTGTLADGRPFYTMRLVAGVPLDRFLLTDTPLAARLSLFQKVCDAAAFAHGRGMVHRDLKPANIMAGEFGEVAVLDWGLARQAEADARAAGTPEFMAPEQAAGAAPSAAADIFSLGAVLASLLPESAPKALRAIAAKAMRQEPEARYRSAAELSADIDRFRDGLAVEAYRESLWERGTRFARRNLTLLLLIAAYFVARISIYFFSGR